MNTLFGIFNRNGAPISPELLDGMARATAQAGSYPMEKWQDVSINLGMLQQSSMIEAQFEAFPLVSSDKNRVLIASARIDNRAELLDLFAIAQADRAMTTDSALIFSAYEKWGRDCPDHLIGDWSFAIWNIADRELFLARDHHGNTALHYYVDTNHFAFSSSLKGLLTLPFVSHDVNEMYVAKILVAWPPDGDETAFKAIHRLPPAHTVTISSSQCLVQRYWYLENAPDVRLKSDEAYLEAFLGIYTRAVHDRLRTIKPVCATLSGGLDSSSVCALAARELGLRGDTLSTYTSIPLQDVEEITSAGWFGDESAFVEQTRTFLGNLDVHYVRAENLSPLTGVRRMLEINPEPGHAAANYYWLLALAEMVQHDGKGILLTGQGGNATVSWTGLKIPALYHFFDKRWMDGGRAFEDTHRQLGILVALRYHFLAPFYHASVDWLNRSRGLIWQNYSAIHPEFTKRLKLQEQMRKSGHDPLFRPSHNPRRQRYWILLPGRTPIGKLWHDIGNAFNLEVRDPTLDKRLMEFCIGLPEDQFWRDGKDRLLIRRAMKGILPDEVRLNEQRGLQSADLGYRLLQYRGEMDEALQHLYSSPSAREMLDLTRLQTYWKKLQTRVDADTTAQSSTILMRGVMAGLFLSSVA